MNINMTELIFLLDRSGSMGGLESDTIGGFNSMLAKQQAESGDCRITTVLFDDKYEVLHDCIDIRAVKPITEREYFVRGNTALLDAVGKTINNIRGVQSDTADEYRAGKVLFIITTDGMENASREFSYGKVKKMIDHQKNKHSWEFIFLGANMDAVEVAGRFGIGENRAQSFHSDAMGTALNYHILGRAISTFRSATGAKLDDNWSEEIDTDYRRRKDNSDA